MKISSTYFFTALLQVRSSGVKAGNIRNRVAKAKPGVMFTQESTSQSLISTEFLSELDFDQLNDLLQHKNKLLTVALVSGIKFRDYILSLKNEIEMIREELDLRRTKIA